MEIEIIINVTRKLSKENMNEKDTISEFCIYTMRKSDNLQYNYLGDGTGKFSEKKIWRTGYALFQKAREENKKMPIFFSAAEKDSGLIYYAILESIEIGDSVTTYSFSNLNKIDEPKPLSSLKLQSSQNPLSDNYIRPYAICYTPDYLIEWIQERGFGLMKEKRKTGSEKFHHNSNEKSFSLLDFWQWSTSGLMNNTTRGVLAEFIVARSLGIAESIRSPWDAYDLLLPNGIKIEVKSSAYIQSWYQKKLSNITFGIGKTRGWNEQTNKQDFELKRQADIYIFCLLNHKIQDTIDPLDMDQWEFYILKTSVLDEEVGGQKRIGLKSLMELDHLYVKYGDIAFSVEKLEEEIDIR